MNPLVPLEELYGLLSSALAAKSFTGAKFVKGFNHLIAATLVTDPVVEDSHRVVFQPSDDEDTITPVADLAKQLGFASVKLGKLNEGGALVHARGYTWGPPYWFSLARVTKKAPARCMAYRRTKSR